MLVPHSRQKSGAAARPAGEFVSVTVDRKWPFSAGRDRLKTPYSNHSQWCDKCPASCNTLLLRLPLQMSVPSRLNEIGQMPNRSVGCPEAISDFIKDDRSHDDPLVVRCLRPGYCLMQTLHI